MLKGSGKELTSPSTYGSSPRMAAKRVVLPAPTSPHIATFSPLLTTISMFLKLGLSQFLFHAIPCALIEMECTSTPFCVSVPSIVLFGPCISGASKNLVIRCKATLASIKAPKTSGSALIGSWSSLIAERKVNTFDVVNAIRK